MDNNRNSVPTAAKVVLAVGGSLLVVWLLYYVFIFALLAAMGV